MVQFNLLPDVKLDFVKARRSKHTAIVIAAAIALTTLIIFVLLFLVVHVVQKKHLNDLNNDIKKYTAQIQKTPDLNKILTVQNQLHSLPGLHDQKPIVSRLPGYIAQVTPAQVSISSLQIDLSAHTITISGTADQLSTINTYVDTLKFTTFANKDGTKHGQAFSNVVLTSFSKGQQTTYSLTMSYDPTIFDNAQEVTLTVPKTITTRGETEKPSALFQPQPTTGGQ